MLLDSTASLAREDYVQPSRAGLRACIERHGRRVCYTYQCTCTSPGDLSNGLRIGTSGGNSFIALYYQSRRSNPYFFSASDRGIRFSVIAWLLL